ncbi:MAG: hypothetical protein HY799_08985 [Nitrosomonadales bacterium]|nr:hypothetical protein [Nitrosomonadales bacterium]
MGYKVFMSPEATKDFRKLDGTVQKRIAALVTKIEATTTRASAGKHSRATTRNGAIA